MKKYLVEVELALRNAKPPQKTSPWLAENYVGAGKSQLQFLNLKIPLVRALYKKGFSFSNLPPADQWQIWHFVWQHSTLFEAMLMPSYWVASRPIVELHTERKHLVRWVDRVDNWAHSDELSSHYAKILEHDPKFIAVFQKWSASRNPWHKRQALVGLFYYSRLRKKVPSYASVIRFVETHIEDDHYYVQKGVGWTLRELWNVYPEQTYKYLLRNARRIPAAGWTAATEKLSAKEKRVLTELRKERLPKMRRKNG